MTHERTVCSEGYLVSQCRCPSDNKTTKRVSHEEFCVPREIIHLESSKLPGISISRADVLGYTPPVEDIVYAEYVKALQAQTRKDFEVWLNGQWNESGGEVSDMGEAGVHKEVLGPEDE